MRTSIADWYGATVRKLVLSAPASRQRPLFSDAFPDESGGDAERVAGLEAISADGACPRSAITLALARPGVYLEHFAAAAEVREEQEQDQDSGVGKEVEERRKRLHRLKVMVGHEGAGRTNGTPQTPQKGRGKRKRPADGRNEDDNGEDKRHSSSVSQAQTDLSVAYSLFLEAGGPGGGTRGRLVNLDDWYRAWLAVRSPSSGGKEDADAQARFALALSTLALLGYIKRTTRGGGGGGRGRKGEAPASGRGVAGVRVAKVGGWDRVLGMEQEREEEMGEEAEAE